MIEHFPLEELGCGGEIRGVAFSPDGNYLVTGDKEAIRVWRVENDKWRVARILEAGPLTLCLSVTISNDGKWIAAGTAWGSVIVWDTVTFQKVFSHSVERWRTWGNNAVDFSPDSSRLVSGSDNRTATVWDRVTGAQLKTLPHDGFVTAAKYSPQGDHIATTTKDSVRVWDSDGGTLLVDIIVTVAPLRNGGGLLWSNDHLFVLSHGKIVEFDASTGSVVSEWPVHHTDKFSCIALAKHGEYIACSVLGTVAFWDKSTHRQLGLVQLPQDTRSIAFSPDDRLLAIGGENGKISIRSLSRSTDYDSIPLSRLHPTFQAPDLQIDGLVLNSWKNEQFELVEALLTAAIDESRNPNHHVLTSRALVRARLRRWNEAFIDAEMAIDAQPSLMGYIAKSVTYIGSGEKLKAYRACDIAFERFHSSHVTFLLLIKAVIVFLAGEHHDAISRVDDLIATVRHNSICFIVQAYMYFFLGNLQMERRDYKGAVQSFERAQSRLRHHTSRPLFMISLIFGWKFDDLNITIQRGLSKALATLHDGHLDWALHVEQLERLGDAAVESREYDEAISHYSTALSLNPTATQGILIKRSKAFIATGSWKQALDDANQAIAFESSSPWGYEMKHAALHKAGDYKNAIDAFGMMLAKMQESADPVIQRCHDQYTSPSTTRATIYTLVQNAIRHLPRELINTTTGRLHNRAAQASAFISSPIFHELISSMTTRIDYVRIKREIRQFFRYVMLSHRWEENEPLYEHVIRFAVYDLDDSSTHDKLQMFCKLVRDAGFTWAWSDTCCINKSDHFVLQEALVAMFKWYRGSALVIVYLRGVPSSSSRGALVKSTWNTRAWTLQEYVAGKAVQFYTEDWTPYLNLNLPNHKESPDIIAEMEQATGVSAQQLMALRPGLGSIREKLCLASTRQTTVVEDAAYSLLGIFSVAGIPAIYGEGEASLGRLLAHVLTGSGDMGILAWTGESGSFNSCLPAHITVFDGPATSHFPSLIPEAEMETIITLCCPDPDVALRLYDRLNGLPPPWFASNRMKLPCIAFELPTFQVTFSEVLRGHIYRADTVTFGPVEIKTRHDLSQMRPLYLIHPWLGAILDREYMDHGAFWDAAPLPLPDDEIVDGESEDYPVSVPQFGSLEPLGPSRTVPMEKERRARRLVARLRQPFGALLVAGGHAMDYKRVAADSLISVRFQENVSLGEILDNVRTLDIL